MNYKHQILQKINNNLEVVEIIGLGYFGLPLAVNFAEAGVKVIGFDKSEAKVNKINSGENYIKDIRDAVLREVVEHVKPEATTDFTRMKECDALIICVPTPLDKFRKPDMSYIEVSCIAIGQHMKPGTFISLESTTYPNTTEGTSKAEGVMSKGLNTAPTSGLPILLNVLTPETKHTTRAIHQRCWGQ